ncbi:MAG: restriction endonuclease subunit S [Bacteroidota bacterium]
MNGYPSVRLDKLCKIQSGGTPRRSRREFYGGSIPWAKIGDLNNGTVFETEETLTDAGLEAIRNRLFPAGTLLFAMYGSIGKLGVAGVDMTTNQAILGIQIKESERLDQNYLRHWFGFIQLRLENMGAGVTQKNLSAKKVRSLEIPLPPLAEQRRIAAVLDRADALRAKRRRAHARLDDLLRAVFLEMFGDPVPNPKEWPIVALGDVCTAQLGKMLSKKAKQGVNPIPYLANASVRWRSFDLSDLSEMDFTAKELVKFDLRAGDLLVCEGGEVGRCAIWQNEFHPCSFQKALHRLRVDTSRAVPEYLQEYFYWMAQNGGLADSTSKATIAHLTGVKLKKLPLPLPPLELQIQFQQIYSSLMKANAIQQASVTRLDDLYQSLAQRAFRGELTGDALAEAVS